jgi:hypothetical protein
MKQFVAVYRAAPRTEFITSDNPVVLPRSNELIAVGAHRGLALGNAGFVFAPISGTLWLSDTAPRRSPAT